MHRLLSRQIRRTLGEEGLARLASSSPDLARLLDLVSDSYTAADADRDLIEHSLGLASEELAARNARLVAELDTRRAAEAALRASQRRLHFQREHMPLGLIEWDARWKVTDWNPAAERIFGWTRLERLGRSTMELRVADDDAGQLSDVVARLDAGATGLRFANRCRCRDGRVIHCEWYGTALRDDAGAIVGVAALVQDVTAEVNARAALTESEERFALAVRGANDGIWDLDFVTGGSHFSPRFLEILGLPPDSESPGLDVWIEHIHPDEREAMRAHLARHIAGETGTYELEMRMAHADGSWRWVLARGAAVRDAEGRALRLAGSITDITDRKRAESELVHASRHDPLTGLPNRAYFLEFLERALARCRRRPSAAFALLFLDVDRFKAVNDTLGHGVGDELLAAVARRLSGLLRAEDLVARLGGDEFALVLDAVHSAEEAGVAASRIVRAMQEPFVLSAREVRTSTSVGIALSSLRASTGEELLRSADLAMYRAKANGRGQWSIFDAHSHGGELERFNLEAALSRAVERGEFSLVFQPIVSLSTGALVGVEALARWHRPGLPDVPPSMFVPLLEEAGLVSELGSWVLAEASRQARAWHAILPPDAYVAVNVSARELSSIGLPALFQQALEREAIPASRLVVELTESHAVSGDVAISNLAALRALGLRLVMDDFGTGYSSLAALLRLPVQGIKIDRSFLADTDRREELLRSILELGRRLGLAAVVEGIETDEQLELARSLGATEGQGFAFARPLEAAEFERWLARRPVAAAHCGA